VALSGKQRRHLRALGHGLAPIVQLGKDGVTGNVVSALDQALEDHELVKVRILASALVDRNEAGDQLAKDTNSEIAQIIGNVLLVYRRHAEEPKIRLP
jgi:RNA-binding protein